MTESAESDFLCGQCGRAVQSDDDFCVHCGALFAEQVQCSRHPGTIAVGVCLICRIPFCADCGTEVGHLFLCQQHSETEVFDVGASVFSSDDLCLAQIAAQVLSETGNHPFLVARASAPHTNLGRLTPDTTVGAHVIIVPFEEFLAAQEVLWKREILT